MKKFYVGPQADYDEGSKISWALAQAYYSLELVMGHYHRHDSKDYFPCVPWSHIRFLKSLKTAETILAELGIDRPSFLDVGCGIGMKVLLAELNGFKSHGIDVHRQYAKLARQLLRVGSPATINKKESKVRIKVRNGLSFLNYDEFDCLYFYKPIKNPEKEDRMERKICTNAKEPSIVISACGNLESFKLKFFRDCVYFKGTKKQWRKISKLLP